MAFLNWESLSHSASCSLRFLACFAVHCCVSKLYWHSSRLLPLPHHLCCSPSLPVPLSPDWLTRIFNFSVYLSPLCLKQHWYSLRARRRRPGECVSGVEMEMSTEECRRRERKEGERRKGATKIGWGRGGGCQKKWKRCKKRERGFLCVLVGGESKGERGRKRSEGLREGEGELILSNSHANWSRGGRRRWERRGVKRGRGEELREWKPGLGEKVRWGTEH